MGKRLNGEGSIYFMKSRNKWASAVIVDGTKVIKYSDTPEDATDRLLDLRNKYRDNSVIIILILRYEKTPFYHSVSYSFGILWRLQKA